MLQVPGLYILETENSGRGVFTSIDLSAGDLIEICPVIEIPAVELSIIHKTVLHDYYFVWGEDNAVHPNADFILDFENKTIEIMAITDIPAGKEITINYHGEPGDDEKLWFPL